MWRLVKETFSEFFDDECSRMAAALAYYTVFSLPAVLTFVVMVAGHFASQEEIATSMHAYFQRSLGDTAAQQLVAMLENANQPGKGWVGWTVGIVVLLVGATGALSEMQHALNKVWGVAPDPRQNSIKIFLIKRALSLAMLLGIAFLLLVSLVLSWFLSEFEEFTHRWAPQAFSATGIYWLNWSISLGVIALLFAVILKYIPDAEVAWRDVWLGAALTALLFEAGKALISAYLSRSSVSSAYGAAGSLAVVLVWIYYSSLIVFLGAEFTQVYARLRGKAIRPEPGAVRIHREERPTDDPSESKQSKPERGASAP